jgi:cobalt-precorrin 5A hydrolase
MPDDRQTVAIVALTDNGVRLALRLREALPGSVCYVPERHAFALAMGAVGFKRTGAVFPAIWPKFKAIVCIMSTGIVVRQVAPLLRHKTADPAVVVLDERGHYVISLLSGHIGGANELAREVARLTGGNPVITTASDVREKPALDLAARDAALEAENPKMFARLARAIVEDEPFWIYDPYDLLASRLEGAGSMVRVDSAGGVPPFSGGSEMAPRVGIWVSERSVPSGLRCLELRPRNLVLGVGCNRGTEAAEILELIRSNFQREGLSLLSIRSLSSVDLKADEAGLLEAAKKLGRPVRFFSRDEIENIATPNPSDIVANHIGVKSVCEATALRSAESGVLVIPKQKTANATLAVVRAAFP